MNVHRPIPKGEYRHYKGHVYRVFGFAKDAETGKPLVLYQRADGSDTTVYVHTCENFNAYVNQDANVPRFELISTEG